MRQFPSTSVYNKKCNETYNSDNYEPLHIILTTYLKHYL